MEFVDDEDAALDSWLWNFGGLPLCPLPLGEYDPPLADFEAEFLVEDGEEPLDPGDGYLLLLLPPLLLPPPPLPPGGRPRPLMAEEEDDSAGTVRDGPSPPRPRLE